MILNELDGYLATNRDEAGIILRGPVCGNGDDQNRRDYFFMAGIFNGEGLRCEQGSWELGEVFSDAIARASRTENPDRLWVEELPELDERYLLTGESEVGILAPKLVYELDGMVFIGPRVFDRFDENAYALCVLAGEERIKSLLERTGHEVYTSTLTSYVFTHFLKQRRVSC